VHALSRALQEKPSAYLRYDMPTECPEHSCQASLLTEARLNTISSVPAHWYYDFTSHFYVHVGFLLAIIDVVVFVLTTLWQSG
jgi:hypothetical protein